MAAKPGRPTTKTVVPALQPAPAETSDRSEEPAVAERVAEALKPLLKNPAEVSRVVMQVVEITERYSGPTPHPEHLERIELIAPGSAHKIISMAFSEQKFRHRVSYLTVLYPFLGLGSGFALSVFCFYLAYLLGMAGHTEVATAMVGVSALGVIGWFIRARLTDRSKDDGAGSTQPGRRTQAKRRQRLSANTQPKPG